MHTLEKGRAKDATLETTAFVVTRGVGQGGIFSNMLFFLAVAPVLRLARKHAWHATAYLDDIHVSLPFNSNSFISNLFEQLALVLLAADMRLNAGKCQFALADGGDKGSPTVEYSEAPDVPAPTPNTDGCSCSERINHSRTRINKMRVCSCFDLFISSFNTL
jgi:hypothetical protein